MDTDWKTPGSVPWGQSKWWILRAVIRAIWILANNLFAVPTYLMWMLLLRPMLCHPRLAPLYWRIDGAMYRWMLIQVSYWSWLAGYTSESSVTQEAINHLEVYMGKENLSTCGQIT